MKTKYLLLAVLFFSIGQMAAQTSGSNDWSWQYPKPQGNTLWDIHVFNKDTAVAVGNFSTIIKTTDGGNNWKVQHHAGGTSNILFDVYFLDAMTGWAAGYNLLKTTDGGENWTVAPLDSIYCRAVYFVDSDTGFVVGANGYISRTTDGGKTWNTKKMDDYIGYGWLDIFNLNAITFTDKQTGWIVGWGYYGNEVYKTTDCGRTWEWEEQIATPKTGGFYDIQFIDKNNGFIVGDHGAFLKTTDGGNNWQNKNLEQEGEDLYLNSVFFTDSLTGWITTSNGCINGYMYGDLILKTIDGGNNWSIVDSNKVGANNNVAQFFNIRFSDKSTGWIVGEKGVIYRTTDAGDNWISQREAKHNFNSIYFVDENTGWAVGCQRGYESELTPIL